MSDPFANAPTLQAVVPDAGEVGPDETDGDFLEGGLDEQLHEATHGAKGRSEPPGYVVAFRYRLLRILGQGGNGSVWEARDLLTGGTVAVKLFDTDQSAVGARICREVASLRMLRLPGVVELLDEGTDGDAPFLVMERLHGAPFPGAPIPASWDRIAPAVLSLLEALARVHAAGIVHRDLKPANVLVDAEGRPTILDFGLARASTPLEEGVTGDGIILGTPAYLAPEQVRGEVVTCATDLYAIGVVLYQALSGALPHASDDLMKVLFARLQRPPAPLASVAPGVPAAVAEVIDHLLALDPADRPRSAEAVLDRLRGDRAEGAPLSGELREPIAAAVRSARAAPNGLRGLFAGHDRLFHVAEDAARLLEARSGGVEALIADHVTAWVRAGIARWDGALIAVERDVIERLEAGLLVLPPARRGRLSEPPRSESTQAEHRRAALAAPPGTPERLYRLLAGAGDDLGLRAEIVAEALHLGDKLAVEGRLALAEVAVSEGLRAARHLGKRGVESAPGLLALGVEIGIEEGTPGALDRALYELYRAKPRTPEIERLVRLVRASLALGQRTDRALRAATALPPFADLELERRRQELRASAVRVRPQAEQEALMAELRAWADASGDAETRGACAGWLGRMRYRQGRFEEAADLHAEAAASARWVTTRLLSLLRSASARMEAFQLEEAAAAARGAREAARRYRLPFHEARAEWIMRSAGYRAGAALTPDFELVEAAAQLRMGDTEAIHCLTEAAIAFRTGMDGVARQLAQRAQRAWAAMGEVSGGALLAGSLALACGGASRPEDVQGLVARALASRVPGIGIQALGLVAMAGLTPGAGEEQIAALAEQVPPSRWDQRLEVLGVREALAAVSRRSYPL